MTPEQLNTARTKTRRIFTMALLGFKRHGLMTVAATTVMALTLFSMLAVVLIRGIADTAITEINRRLDLAADVQDDADIAEVITLVRELRLKPEVLSVTYVSKDEALDRAIGTESETDIKSFLSKYNIDNPLSAKIHIVTNDPGNHAAILSFLKRPHNQQLVSVQRTEGDTTYQARIQRIMQITAGVRSTGLLITIIFAAIAFLIILNTIRITIHNRSQEIEIMQLVGADSYFVRGPLIIESILYGICGTILSTIIFYVLLALLGGNIRSYFGASVFAEFSIIGSLLLQFAVGIILGTVSATIAMQRYLKQTLTM